jgi:hypothetical protein
MYCSELQQNVPGVDITARPAVHYLFNKCNTMGLVLDKKTERRCHLMISVHDWSVCQDNNWRN